MKQPSLREEIAGLRAEVEQLRHTTARSGVSPDPVDPDSADQPGDVQKLLGELGDLVQTMLDEAEESVSDHPAIAVSAALALGIGRLTAR